MPQRASKKPTKAKVQKTSSTKKTSVLDGRSTLLTKSKAKTMQDRILYILQEATTLVGLPTLKKQLKEVFNIKESKLFNSHVNKALKDLGTSCRMDFGKIGGSYHGGEKSKAFVAHQLLLEKDRVTADEEARMKEEGCIKCCFCGTWCGNDCELGEDSIARGSEYECSGCQRTFWTWISDGYDIAHDVEYKYS